MGIQQKILHTLGRMSRRSSQLLWKKVSNCRSSK